MKWILLAGAALALGLAAARAELVIYNLSFGDISTSVNLPIFAGGYIVLDDSAGSFDSVIVLEDPDTAEQYYSTSLISGTYFELASGGGSNYGVLNGVASGNSTTAESLAFQVVGKTSGDVDVGPGVSLRVAKKMKGFLMSNSQETVTANTTTDTTTIEYGFAGSNKVTARYDSASTQDANNSRLDAATALTAITEYLEGQGIGPQPTPTPSPTATPTPTPST